MPKQNRPLVRDGRIQGRKKRTDRSYLRPNGAAAPVAEEPEQEEEVMAAEAVEEAPAVESSAPDAGTEIGAEIAEEAPAATTSTAAPASINGTSASMNGAAAQTRLTGTARALQQQGVRKRREFDVNALAIRDSKYALHEIRRIAILATMVVITLIVLAVVLR